MMEVRVDGWKKALRFSSAHATLNLGKCERLHGHTYVIHANVRGELEQRRIVFDFVLLNRALREIADELDHYIFVPTRGEPEITVRIEGERVHMRAGDTDYELPRRDCFLLPRPSSTAEDLAHYCLERLLEKVDFPPNVQEIDLGVDEGYGQGAWVHWRRQATKKVTP